MEPESSDLTCEPKEKEACQFCGKYYMKGRGMSNHITRAHPEHGRAKTANKYETPVNTEIEVYEDEERDPQTVSDRTAELNKTLEMYDNELQQIYDNFDQNKFEEILAKVTSFLREAVQFLPGPKHPATKFYQKRKLKEFASSDGTYRESTNPERASKRKRAKRNEKYQFQTMQYLYHNQRKKCVNRIMTSGSKPCKIPISTLHESFNNRWGMTNNKVRPEYEQIDPTFQDSLDQEFKSKSKISEEEIKDAIKLINADTSPGVDKILIRTLKRLDCSKLFSTIASIMLKHNYVPSNFKEARTVLIFKSGDPENPNNWRPISICSIVRRVIEKVLEARLREYIHLNPHQRGFINQPGTHINTSILNACLKKSKKSKKNLILVFLDITKAFDFVGHEHVRRTLESQAIPNQLRDLVWTLQNGNYTRLEVSGNKSAPIMFERGILQGAPLSPLIFNLCIDYVLNSLTEKEVSSQFGFTLVPTLDNLSSLCFADDTCLIANSKISAAELTVMATILFEQCGLEINPSKSSAICVEGGKLDVSELVIDPDTTIASLKTEESIKYLGVTFNSEIVVDKARIISVFKENLELLVSSAVLRPDQKFNIINQYLWPTLIYPFQTAPIHKLHASFLEDIDKIIRSAVKEILAVPSDIPNSMIYSSTACKGMGIMRAQWEAFIQAYSICLRLLTSDCQYLPYVRNLKLEMEEILKHLNIDPEILKDPDPPESELEEPQSVKKKKKVKQTKIIRKVLTDREYSAWCSLPHKGKGVSLFQQCPSINKLLWRKQGLSSSEWTSSIKMVANVAAVRTIPGRSQDSRCRHCDEFETLSHVLGKCDHGMLLRNTRHHMIRSILAEALRENSLTVHEEIHCTAVGDSNRRVDIIAFDPSTKSGYIIDPTVRMEIDDQQPEKVNQEKQAIYNGCIPYLKEKYGLEHLEVIGLLVGARGTITQFFKDFSKMFGLRQAVMEQVAITAVKGSSQILHNHLYNHFQ